MSPGARNGKQRVRAARQAMYRQLVLAGAERVFADKGYEDAKMEEIAQESDLSLSTLYSVFTGKAAVYGAVHEAGDRALLERAVERARGLRDPLEALLAGVRSYTEYFLEHPDFLRMHLREGLGWGTEVAGANSRARTQAWNEGVALLTAAFRRCIEAGVFHDGDPGLQARMMIAMQQVQLADWVATGMERRPDEVLEEIALFVERCFRRAPQP